MSRQKHTSFGRVLLKMGKVQPWRYAAALFLWTSIWTMPVLVGFITAYFFDELLAGIQPSQVVLVVVATFGYAAGRSIVIFLGMRNHGSLLFRAGATIRRNLLTRIFEMPGAAAVDETPGEIVSRFRDDVDHIVEPFDISVDFLGAAVSGTISFIIFWSIDPVITIAIAIPVVVVGVVSTQMGGVIRRYRRAAREATEAITGFLGETFAATQAVKVAGTEQPMLERFIALNAVRKKMMVRDRTLSEALHAVFRNTLNIGTGLILLLAAGRLNQTGSTGMTIGEFALFVYLLHVVSDAAYFVGAFIARAKQGSVSVEKITRTMRGEPWTRAFEKTDLWLDTEPPPPAPSTSDHPGFQSLEVRGLSYTYPGSDNGITDVDLDIRRGEFVVVTGRIGSGKTTLLRTILGLLPADSGTILWNGQAIDDPSSALVPPNAAYTPQVPKLFSMSLRDNLDLGADVSDHLMNESIYIATMRHDVDLMPEGLETLVGPRGVRLSGGQIQRSASARMLTRDPRLLVLDDVSSALDVETEQILWRRLYNARRDVAALVVSHRHAALARADRVIVMDGGRVVGVGSATELQESSDAFRAIWEGALSATSPA